MGKKIHQLEGEFLRTWQQICGQVWLFENVTLGPDQFTPNRAIEQYSLQQEFIRRCIEEYDIDETKDFTISQATGLIYYLENE